MEKISGFEIIKFPEIQHEVTRVSTQFEKLRILKKNSKCVTFGTESTNFEKNVHVLVEIVDSFIYNK